MSFDTYFIYYWLMKRAFWLFSQPSHPAGGRREALPAVCVPSGLSHLRALSPPGFLQTAAPMGTRALQTQANEGTNSFSLCPPGSGRGAALCGRGRRWLGPLPDLVLRYEAVDLRHVRLRRCRATAGGGAVLAPRPLKKGGKSAQCFPLAAAPLFLRQWLFWGACIWYFKIIIFYVIQ